MEGNNNRPLSEQYRLAAEAYVDAEARARELEEGKSVFLSQAISSMCADDSKMSVAKAEREVKSSDTYRSYLRRMHDARTESNLRKIDCDVIKMKHSEQMHINASARDERRLG